MGPALINSLTPASKADSLAQPPDADDPPSATARFFRSDPLDMIVVAFFKT
jgi:hypothetical protein